MFDAIDFKWNDEEKEVIKTMNKNKECRYCKIKNVDYEADRKIRKNERMTIQLVQNMMNKDKYYLQVKPNQITGECIEINYCPLCRKKVKRGVTMQNKEIEDNTFKMSIPLITNAELNAIDNNLDDFVNQITKQVIHDKDLLVAQHVIKRQKEYIEQLENKVKETIQQLKKEYKQLTQSVKRYEEMRRNCKDDSFYKKSYQTTIHKLNAKRETISNIIDLLEK